MRILSSIIIHQQQQLLIIELLTTQQHCVKTLAVYTLRFCSEVNRAKIQDKTVEHKTETNDCNDVHRAQ